MDKWPMQFSFNKFSISTTGRLLQIAKQLRERRHFGYGAAFLTIGGATAVQWLAYDEYSGTTFLTIYPAVIVTTLIGGWAKILLPSTWE